MKYKDLLILKLSDAAEWKNDREMIIPEDMMKDYSGYLYTCEFLGNGKYILRGYWENGNKYWETGWQNDQKHGKSFGWWEDGKKYWEREYREGLRQGIDIGWWKDGGEYWREEYQNGVHIPRASC